MTSTAPVRLGQLAVGRLGLGTMSLTGPGVWGAPEDADEARGVLRRAVELGIDFFDTADSYGPAAAETLVADALHPYDGPRRRDEGGPYTAGAGALEQGRAPRVPPSSLPREPRAPARRADRPLPATRGRSRGTDRGVGRSALRASLRREDPSCRRVQRRRGAARAGRSQSSRSSPCRTASRSPTAPRATCSTSASATGSRSSRGRRSRRARSRAPNRRSTRSRARTTRRPARSRSPGSSPVSRHAADSGNILGGAPRGKPCGERRAPYSRRPRCPRAAVLHAADSTRTRRRGTPPEKVGAALSDWQVETVRHSEELEALREPWGRLQGRHFPTDPDAFRTILNHQSEVVRPHVLLLVRGGVPQTLLLGRLDDMRLNTKVGYKKVYAPRLRALTVVNEGVLGDDSEDVCRLLFGHASWLPRGG